MNGWLRTHQGAPGLSVYSVGMTWWEAALWTAAAIVVAAVVVAAVLAWGKQ